MVVAWSTLPVRSGVRHRGFDDGELLPGGIQVSRGASAGQGRNSHVSERTIKSNREQVQRDWAERGFSCELWVDPPNTVWADFLHDEDELVLLLEGSLLLEMRGQALRLEPGDEVLIPKGAQHTVRTLGDGAARWLYGYRRTGQPTP
jgi:mannose-6-phosphate isomerase-like protein (cupin superfamily)